MEQNRKKDLTESYFGTLPTVHIYARYKEGKYFDIDTNKEVVLSNNTFVKMVTLKANITDEDYLKITEVIRKKVLPEGTLLFMRMPMVNEGEYVLKVLLLDDLIMKKSGNKEAMVESCRCEVLDRIERGRFSNSVKFEPFKADSLNQAFFQASIRYRPNSKSHSANIYQYCYLEDGRSISVLRF